jgi:hypothetical protein
MKTAIKKSTKKSKIPANTIFVHIPAYREPELVPTIKDCMAQAKYPKNLRFGICRQFEASDGFDNLDEFRDDSRFRIIDMPAIEARGLPYARQQINNILFKDETYILQLDSHHRFVKDWDEILINYHNRAKEMGYKKPILAGYLPYYDPFDDPASRCTEPWQQQFASFYPHGTIFIRPGLLQGWQDMVDPVPSRFLSGHFCFADGHWARTIEHDPDIFFSGEELNLTTRSFTHGYDLLHIPKIVVWHATNRTERDGILVWDDQAKRGEDWWSAQRYGWKKIRTLLRTEDSGIDLTGFDLGTERTLKDYEHYAGFDFKNKRVQWYTLQNNFPPNPYTTDEEWEKGFAQSFYQNLRFDKTIFKHDDYECWIFSFDDVNGIGIWREDFNEYQVKEIMSRSDQFVSIEKFGMVSQIPYKWVIWAYSKSAGWAERLEHIIDDWGNKNG